MIALVLAAAVVIPTPKNVDEACDPQFLAPFLSAPKTEQINNEMDLDRRFAATLAEERRLEAEVATAGDKAKAAAAASSGGRWLLLALALAGLGMGAASVKRGSLPMTLAAWALVAAAGGIGWVLGARATDAAAEHQQLTARQLALGQCRSRVAETRSQLMHSRVAACTHDLGEVDEDIWGWITRMRSHDQPGFVVTDPMLEHMHKEITAALKY